jgi:hypothetical protein
MIYITLYVRTDSLEPSVVLKVVITELRDRWLVDIQSKKPLAHCSEFYFIKLQILQFYLFLLFSF